MPLAWQSSYRSRTVIKHNPIRALEMSVAVASMLCAAAAAVRGRRPRLVNAPRALPLLMPTRCCLCWRPRCARALHAAQPVDICTGSLLLPSKCTCTWTCGSSYDQTWRGRAGELGMSSTHLDRTVWHHPWRRTGQSTSCIPSVWRLLRCRWAAQPCRSSSGRFPIAPTLTEPLGWLTRKVPCQHGRSAQHRSAEHNICAARVPRFQ